MAITPYDKSAFAQFTPLSGQEILQPALMMRERHDAIDDEYSQLSDAASRASFIAEQARTNGDYALASQYDNYLNSLSQASDELMRSGVTGSSRRNMQNIRSRFQSEIQPMIMGHELKTQDVMRFNDILAKDPTYKGIDPNTRSVSDYINNNLTPFTQQGVSGDQLRKQAADIAGQFAQKLSTGELRPLLETRFGAMNYERMISYGLTPGTEEYAALQELIREQVLGSTDLSWANEQQIRELDSFIAQGVTAAIGKDDIQMIDNKMFNYNMGEAQAARAFGNQIALQDRQFNQQKEMAEFNYQKAMDMEEWRTQRALALQGMKNAAKSGATGMGNSFNPFTSVDRPLRNTGNKQEVDKYINESLSKDTTQTKAVATAKTGNDYLRATSGQSVGKAFGNNRERNEMAIAIDAFNQIEGLDAQKQQELLDKIQSELGEAAGATNLFNEGTRALPGILAAAMFAPESQALMFNVIKGYIPAVAMLSLKGDTEGPRFSGILENLAKIPEMRAANNSIPEIKAYYKDKGINLKDEELESIVRAEYRNRSYLGETIERDTSAATSAQEKREADALLANVSTSGGIIKDPKGKITRANDPKSKLTNEDYKNAVFKGHVPYNSEYGGSSTYEYTVTKDGKDYEISLPSKLLTNSYGLYSTIIGSIKQGFSPVKTINYGGETYKLTTDVTPNGGFSYTVTDENGISMSLEQIKAMAAAGVVERYDEKNIPQSKRESAVDDYYSIITRIWE